MRVSYPHTGLGQLTRLFGITRQAYYKHYRRQEENHCRDELVLKMVTSIRSDHPVMSIRKIYEKIKPELRRLGIKMGRDALFDLARKHHLLVRRRKRKVRTTQSNHWLRKYPNLIKDRPAPEAPEQLWVSDITYWQHADRHLFLYLITDAYSRKIVGYHIADSLESVNAQAALKQAITQLNTSISERELIHHSDRGLQYCAHRYVALLEKNNIGISMSENGDPLENPIAERMNGIIKQEYLDYYVKMENGSVMKLKELLDKAVRMYNTQRPHLSCNYMTPAQAHRKRGPIPRAWKKYYRKHNCKPKNGLK